VSANETCSRCKELVLSERGKAAEHERHDYVYFNNDGIGPVRCSGSGKRTQEQIERGQVKRASRLAKAFEKHRADAEVFHDAMLEGRPVPENRLAFIVDVALAHYRARFGVRIKRAVSLEPRVDGTRRAPRFDVYCTFCRRLLRGAWRVSRLTEPQPERNADPGEAAFDHAMLCGLRVVIGTLEPRPPSDRLPPEDQ
jgi:hypothetical protein